jgi:hypothetical protein
MGGTRNRYRSCFQLFWLRADAAFAKPEIYVYNESQWVTYFIRLALNEILKRRIHDHLTRPQGRFRRSGIKVRFVGLTYQAASWSKPRRVASNIKWYRDELFPRVGFLVTNSRLSAKEVVRIYNGRGNVENRIKESKNTLRWDKTSCHKFNANQARLKMGLLAYKLLQLQRQFYVKGEEVQRSVDLMVRRLIKVASRITYHGRYWRAYVASAFSLRYHFKEVLEAS